MLCASGLFLVVPSVGCRQGGALSVLLHGEMHNLDTGALQQFHTVGDAVHVREHHACDARLYD